MRLLESPSALTWSRVAPGLMVTSAERAPARGWLTRSPGRAWPVVRGEAMSHNHPLWAQQDVAKAKAALDRLAPTHEARLAKARLPKEKAFLEAQQVLYFSPGDKLTLIIARRPCLLHAGMLKRRRAAEEQAE